MLLVINPRAGGGTALDRWHRIEPEFRAASRLEVTVVDNPHSLDAVVAGGIAAGHGTFLAGGGDGTVNALADVLLRTLGTVRTLGAIGLGSSNDFHKPFHCLCAGIPYRTDAGHARRADVGRLDIENPDGVRAVRHWVVNASLGVTADANLRFNLGRGALGRVKRVAPGAAIAMAAAATLLRDRGRELTVSVDGAAVSGRRFRNLAFVKNPHFAGCLHYETDVPCGDGAFRFHAVADVSLARMLAILAGLARGRFRGRRGTSSREATTARVTARKPFAVEFDGEVVEAVSVTVSLIPAALEVCA